MPGAFKGQLGRRIAFWLCVISTLLALSWVTAGLAHFMGLEDWMHPLMDLTDQDTHRFFQIINFIVAALLLGLTITIYLLKVRLDQKIQFLATAHQKLLDQSELLRLATEATPIGIWDFYPQENSGAFSQQWYAMFGYPWNPDRVPLAEFQSRIHPEDRFAAEAALAGYLRNGGQGLFETELRIRRVDGIFYWVLAKGRCIAWDDKGMPTRIIGLHLNIQNLKEAQEELARSEARSRAIFESAPFSIIINDLKDGRFLDANRRFLEQLELSKEALRQLKLQDFANFSNKQIDEVFALLLKEGTVRDVEGSFAKRDGTTCHFIYSSVLLDLQGQRQVISMFIDITERRRVEEERRILQDQLHQSQKMEAIGTLAGGIAHDFNNILSSIIGFTELSIAGLPEDQKTIEYLEQVLQAGLRARDLVSHILSFSRQGEHRVETIQLHTIIKEVAKFLRASIPANIEIIQKISPHCCPVVADPTQIHQIIMNLCTNSYHAIGNRKGRIIISLEESEIGPHDFPEMSDVRCGRHVKLTVSDTGHGMDQATLGRIFDPYFTTKRKGEGTGLGLAVVHGIVKKHSGHITVYSKQGHGTSFHVYLPCATDQEKNQEDATMEVQGGNERIMIVDDEKAILDMLKEALIRLGYRVTAFNDADQAVEVCQSRPDAFDLIITDMNMPTMSGEELSRLIHKINPQVPVIIQTGSSGDLDRDQLQSIGVKAILKKPVLEREMAQCIRSVIDKNE